MADKDLVVACKSVGETERLTFYLFYSQFYNFHCTIACHKGDSIRHSKQPCRTPSPSFLRHIAPLKVRACAYDSQPVEILLHLRPHTFFNNETILLNTALRYNYLHIDSIKNTNSPLPSWTAFKIAASSVTATHLTVHTARNIAEWPTWKRRPSQTRAHQLLQWLSGLNRNEMPVTNYHPHSTSTKNEHLDMMLLQQLTRSDHDHHTSCGQHQLTSTSEPHQRSVHYHRRHRGPHYRQRQARRV